MSELLNHLGSIWYHSEPSDVPYSENLPRPISWFGLFLQQNDSSIITQYSKKTNFSQIQISLISCIVKWFYETELQAFYLYLKFDIYLKYFMDKIPKKSAIVAGIGSFGCHIACQERQITYTTSHGTLYQFFLEQ